METRYMYFPSEFTTRDQSEESAPVIEGYFAVFADETELCPGIFEEIAVGAFDKSLKENDIRGLFNHRTDLVLGRLSSGTLELKVDDHGLYGTLSINAADNEAMNVYQRVKRGDVSNCSFGFNPIQEETINRDDGSVKFVVKEADLMEVSIVTFPAYPQTEVEARQKDVDSLKKRQRDAWKTRMLQKLKGEN